MIPAPGIKPTVGLMPTSPFTDDGETMEPSVSVPTPAAQRLAATAAPVPELEPEGTRVECVGIAGLAAASAPSADRMAGAEVRPLAEIGLAEDDRARGAEAGNEFGVFRSGGSEGEGAGRGHHFVASVDVVLDEDGDAVEGAAGTFLFALAIEVGGDGGGVGVQFDDGVEAGALFADGFIDGADAGDLLVDQMGGGPVAGGEAFLKLGDGELARLED